MEGVGPKTAPRLLKLYGNIEGCVANAKAPEGSDIKNKRVRENLASKKGAASAFLCRNLVKIRTRLNAPTLRAPATSAVQHSCAPRGESGPDRASPTRRLPSRPRR